MSICITRENRREAVDRRQFRLRLADLVECCQPLTLESLAGKLTASIAEVDLEIGYGAMRVANRVLKRWTDNTPLGRAREFIGTVGTLGFAEPDGNQPCEGELAMVDPRTLLAMLRAGGALKIKLLAGRFGVAFGEMMESVRSLVYAGHVFHRRNRDGYWAVLATRPPRRVCT